MNMTAAGLPQMPHLPQQFGAPGGSAALRWWGAGEGVVSIFLFIFIFIFIKE